MRTEARSVVADRSLALRTVPLGMPECPIEQAIRSADPGVRSALHAEARRRPARLADAWLVADDAGVRVLARTEGALRPLVERIVDRHGRDVVVGAPRVRYLHRPHLAEPWMRVIVGGTSTFLPLVLRDLERRKGRTVRIDDHGGAFVLDAEAPLANLLGYAGWLDDLCEGRADLSMWLARYADVDVDDGPDAA